MIYEMRTYTLKVRTVPQFEAGFVLAVTRLAKRNRA